MKEIITKLTVIKNDILKEKEGQLRFLGLIARADVEDKWDLLVSADWIKKSNSEEDLIYIIKKLKGVFAENLNFLSRIVLLTPQETFIKQLARAIINEKVGNTGEFANLKTSADFTIKQVFVITLDFTDINLENSQEIGDGFVGAKDVVEF